MGTLTVASAQAQGMNVLGEARHSEAGSQFAKAAAPWGHQAECGLGYRKTYL